MDPSLRGYAVNPACCNGCGACAAVCPALFAMDAAGRPVVLLPEAPLDLIERAMAYCPRDCIETS